MENTEATKKADKLILQAKIEKEQKNTSNPYIRKLFVSTLIVLIGIFIFWSINQAEDKIPLEKTTLSISSIVVWLFVYRFSTLINRKKEKPINESFLFLMLIILSSITTSLII